MRPRRWGEHVAVGSYGSGCESGGGLARGVGALGCTEGVTRGFRDWAAPRFLGEASPPWEAGSGRVKTNVLTDIISIRFFLKPQLPSQGRRRHVLARLCSSAGCWRPLVARGAAAPRWVPSSAAHTLHLRGACGAPRPCLGAGDRAKPSGLWGGQTTRREAEPAGADEREGGVWEPPGRAAVLGAGAGVDGTLNNIAAAARRKRGVRPHRAQETVSGGVWVWGH